MNNASRITPVTLMRGARGLVFWRNLLAGGAVGVVCATLAVAIWSVAARQIDRQRHQALLRGETVVVGQANVLAEAVRQELNTIDQSLTILQAAWSSDPAQFSLTSWQARMPALTEVSDDIFIADDRHMIVQDILPQAVGQGVGAAYVRIGNGALESVLAAYRAGRNPGLVMGEKAENGIVRQYLMYMVRPLRQPPGWLIGASYRSAALVKVFAEGALGAHGVVALIDTRRGGVQAVAGPAALRPRLNVADTAMYRNIVARNTDDGTWIGPTGMDGAMRIHAFRRIPGRQLLVLAGVDEADWLAPANAWARGARLVAALASVLVLAIGAVVLWALWRWDTNRRRKAALEQAAIRLNSAHSGLEAAERTAQTGLVQLRAMMAGSSDGIAVFDADERLAAWNGPFALQAGVPAGALHTGLPADELLRQQARAGLLGPFKDLEAEVAARLARLRDATDLVALSQPGPDGRALQLRGCATPDGGLVLLMTATVLAADRQIPPPEPAQVAESVEEPPAEW